MTVLKDRARGDRHLVSALATAPAGTSHRPRRLSCASRTYPSPGPAQRAQVRRASLLPAEASFQFQQGPRIVLAHVEKHYILGLVASSKYPSSAMSSHFLASRHSPAYDQTPPQGSLALSLAPLR